MERSIEYPAFGSAAKRRWTRELPTVSAAETEGPKTAFRLLILFLVVLYSNVAVLYPQLNAFRPAMIIAVGALTMMVIEMSQLRQSFKLMWPQSAAVIAFFGACVISTPTAIWVRNAYDTTTDLGKIVLTYVLIENVITNEKRLRTIMWTMVLCGLFPAIGTINHYRAGILVEKSRAAWRGIFGNPNEVAYAILLLIPLAMVLASKARWPIRIGLWGIIAVYLLAIFLTFSRGGLLALFSVLAVFGWKQKSVVIKAVLIAALVGGIVVVGMFWTRNSGDFKNIKEDVSVQTRWATFQAGGLMFLNNPLFGVGPGDSKVAYALYVPMAAHCGCQDQLVIHNSYIQVLGELGLIGFVPFMVFVFYSLYAAWKMENGPLGPYAMALGLAMWGFIMCSLSGGFTYTWWPYLLVGLIAAAKRISDAKTAEAV